MTKAKEAPLVIIQGMAGTAKTFYSLAVGMEKVYNNPSGEYRRIIVCRPNAQFDDDIGNAINRKNHAEYGAILANTILGKMDMPLEDRVVIASAIGNHDESTGGAVDAISAALILADKTDVRRNRVTNKDKASFDKHDRVNYAVTNAKVKVNPDKHLIALNLQIDEEICTMYEYFEIFLGRMMMCRGAAELLGAKFKLTANGSKVL